MRIREVIVVEGKNDTNVVQSAVECDTIETHGTSLGDDVFQQIQQAKDARGIIIFTDPDHPGEYIRNEINKRIPGCKNAFIAKNKAKTPKKVGVEHAKQDDILEALQHLMTYEENVQETISKQDLIELGLVGGNDSALRRSVIAQQLHLGKPNAKTLWKRLNMLQLHREDIEHMLDEKEKI